METLIDSCANRLNVAMQMRKIKPSELSDATGLSKSKISSYMSGRFKPKQDGLYIIAKYLNVSEAWLMGLDVPMERGYYLQDETDFESVMIPVLGRIPAGVPIEMIVDSNGEYETIPRKWLRGGKEYFALKIKGDSMEPDYLDGDTIIVLKSSTCSDGEECVVSVNNNDATFKKVYIDNDKLTLSPLNRKYAPMTFNREEIERLPVRVLGIAKQLRRNVHAKTKSGSATINDMFKPWK